MGMRRGGGAAAEGPRFKSIDPVTIYHDTLDIFLFWSCNHALTKQQCIYVLLSLKSKNDNISTKFLQKCNHDSYNQKSLKQLRGSILYFRTLGFRRSLASS